MKRIWVALTVVIGGMTLFITSARALEQPATCNTESSAWCVAPRVTPSVEIISGATVPKLATPSWMAPPAAPTSTRIVTYSVSTRGTITSDLAEFKSVVNATLNDSRGWTRLGVSFSEVESGGEFTVFLSEASQMTTFSANGCDTTYSCNVGRAVIINQDRWVGSTPSWSGAGRDLASYRQMVINHETGHWLGHGHRYCGGAGQSAPVMQQQSMDMQGCTTNSWPQSAELYSPTLGIRS